MRLDVAIFGGGASGLWLLDELARRGQRVALLEASQLGSGQTVASQGIIHGGVKYSLHGNLTASAARIREMPLVWRDSLAGRRPPCLQHTRLRSNLCYLWHTGTVTSRLGMLGARLGLRVVPEPVTRQSRPRVLADCPGTVARLNEQVIAPQSLLSELAERHRERIIQIDAANGLDFEVTESGAVRAIIAADPASGRQLELRPAHVALTAGAGNAALRQRIGLPADLMQRRPLHMVIVRGALPWLNGHCVDGAKTRVTVTSDFDSSGATVWQLGGQIAEQGVALDAPTLIKQARSELEAVIPGLDLSECEWATYRIDRAEGETPNGRRPESISINREGNVVTAWPTKLALVPLLAEQVADLVSQPASHQPAPLRLPDDWPRPPVAQPPWETCRDWLRFDSGAEQNRYAA